MGPNTEMLWRELDRIYASPKEGIPAAARDDYAPEEESKVAAYF